MYSDHVASPVLTGLRSMAKRVGTSQETSHNISNTPLARSGSVPDTSGPLDTRIDLITPLATSDLRTIADPVDNAPPPSYNFDNIPDDTPSPPATVFPTFAACPMLLWAPRASTSLGFAFAFSARGRWAGTMPVFSSPPEANDLESIDEDSPCPPLPASPNLALSQSSPLLHAAPIAAQSLLHLSLQAAPIAASSSYPCASVAKPVIRSPEHTASAHHIVTPPLKAPSAGALHLVKVQHVSHHENCIQVPHLALLDWTKYNRITDWLPVSPKPPDVIRHAAHAFQCL